MSCQRFLLIYDTREKKIGTKNVLDLHATAVASATAIISVNNREEVQTSSA